MKLRDQIKLGWVILAVVLRIHTSAAEPPKVGEKAPEFSLMTLDNQRIQLGELTANANVVIVVLRGWPGYNCPLCTIQVQDLLDSADELLKRSQVLLVYPGPSEDLKAHAEEFLKHKQWRNDFRFLLDPDYRMVTSYGLRWKAPNETAYPAAFILNKKGIVSFARVSRGHGGRTEASELIKALSQFGEN